MGGSLPAMEFDCRKLEKGETGHVFFFILERGETADHFFEEESLGLGWLESCFSDLLVVNSGLLRCLTQCSLPTKTGNL